MKRGPKQTERIRSLNLQDEGECRAGRPRHDAAVLLHNTTKPDRVPPGPWTWQHVRPTDAPDRRPEDIVPTSTDEEGIALVAADDTWLLWSEGGYGTPELLSRAVEDLLRKAWQVPQLVRELDEVADKLDEARRVARHLYYADGRLLSEYGVGREPAPDWLTNPEPPAGS